MAEGHSDAVFDENNPLSLLVRKLLQHTQLNGGDLAHLAALPIRLEEVPRHRELVREGDKPDQCCLLTSGYACRYKVAEGGARQIVSFHMEGDLLDIQHLLLSKADHSVGMVTPGSVAWIPKQELIGCISESGNIASALWRDSLIDASVFREWVLNVGRREAQARIAHMLCEFIERRRARGIDRLSEFTFPLTQEEIADATGLTSVHVNRSLKALDEEGAISRNRRQFRLLDWDSLSRIADFDSAYLHAAAAAT